MGDERFEAGVAQLVERQPSKLEVAGSNPVARSIRRGRDWSEVRKIRRRAHVAQSAERVLGKDEVTSSNLVVGSKESENADLLETQEKQTRG